MERHYVVFDADGQVVTRGTTTYRGPLERLCKPGQTVVEGQDANMPAPPPAATAADVKRHAQRLLRGSDWYVLRAAEPDGTPVPQSVLDYRAAVRTASGDIEARDPIPTDYRDAKYWPPAP